MPIFGVALITCMQGNTPRYELLFGGTELFLICLFIVGSTVRDLENAKVHLRGWSPFELARDALLILAMLISMMSAYVFLDLHMHSLAFKREAVANMGIVLAGLSTAICLPAQVMLARAEKPKREYIAKRESV